MNKCALTFSAWLALCVSGCVGAKEAAPRQVGHTRSQAGQAQQMLAGLETKLPTLAALPERDMTPARVSGHYSDPGPELQKHIGGGLSGSDLYLFPDGSYLYTEWADILETTIFDRGKWAADSGLVVLESDRTIPSHGSLLEHTYLPLLPREGVADGWFLLGTERSYQYYLKHASDDSEFLFYVCSLEREEGIPADRAEQIRDRLMKCCWRPEWFEGETQSPPRDKNAP